MSLNVPLNVRNLTTKFLQDLASETPIAVRKVIIENGQIEITYTNGSSISYNLYTCNKPNTPNPEIMSLSEIPLFFKNIDED